MRVTFSNMNFNHFGKISEFWQDRHTHSYSYSYIYGIGISLDIEPEEFRVLYDNPTTVVSTCIYCKGDWRKIHTWKYPRK